MPTTRACTRLTAQITERYETNSEATRARIGPPRRYAYGPTPIEALDVYTTMRPDAPINVFIHGGAWRGGLAKDYAFPAELFVHAGAHYVVLDFTTVQDGGGSLMTMPIRYAVRLPGCIAMPRPSAGFQPPLRFRLLFGRASRRRGPHHRLDERL